MVAKLQRFIVFSLLFASAVAVALGVWAHHAVLGVLAAALLIFGYAGVLAAEFVCIAFVEARHVRPGMADLLRAGWGEAWMTPLVFYWRQPFRADAEPDSVPSAPDGRRGVLLVHGLVCNRGFWNPWQRRLRKLGVATIALTLEPVFGSIEAHAPAIEAAVRRLTSSTGVAPVIVAHSMGGLVVRHWLRAQAGRVRVHRVITIGTPHRGTWAARFARGSNGRQMVIDNEWLSALDAATAAAGHARDFTCFYGDCDNVVFPSARARLSGADNRCIGRTAHVALAFHREVFAEVLRWLEVPVDDQASTRSPGKTSPGSSSPSSETRR